MTRGNTRGKDYSLGTKSARAWEGRIGLSNPIAALSTDL